MWGLGKGRLTSPEIGGGLAARAKGYLYSPEARPKVTCTALNEPKSETQGDLYNAEARPKEEP